MRLSLLSAGGWLSQLLMIAGEGEMDRQEDEEIMKPGKSLGEWARLCSCTLAVIECHWDLMGKVRITTTHHQWGT